MAGTDVQTLTEQLQIDTGRVKTWWEVGIPFSMVFFNAVSSAPMRNEHSTTGALNHARLFLFFLKMIKK